MVDKQFSVLKKCRSKFDCLFFEMLFIRELNPELNTQKDSIRAKLFTRLCVRILCYLHIFTLLFVSPRNSFTFIFVLISLIIDLIMNDVKRTPKRRRIFKLITKVAFNFLNFSTLSQFFLLKLFKNVFFFFGVN